MKYYKIKKRSHRQPIFIIGPPIASFPKPKLPNLLINKIHKPGFFKPQSNFSIEIIDFASELVEEPAVVEAEPVVALDLSEPMVSVMLAFAQGNLESGFEQLSEIVAKPVE